MQIEYTKESPWRDSDGTVSFCIGCDFNITEDWPDSMFGELPTTDGKTMVIKRENFFPEVNFVCRNPISPMFEKCIIGHTGCDKTSLI